MIKYLKIFSWLLGFIIIPNLWSQTEGIPYQAVITDPSIQEIPGVDIQGNLYINKPVAVLFTINNTNETVYQEQHDLISDAFGKIETIIGTGTVIQGIFHQLHWDGSPRNLEVHINIGNGWQNFGIYPLHYIPFAKHRNLFVSEDIEVLGEVLFTGDLIVRGTTDFNQRLHINNQSATSLSGTLNVQGQSSFNDLNIQGNTLLEQGLQVHGNSSLSGDLGVTQNTNLQQNLQVQGITQLHQDLDILGNGQNILSGNLQVDGQTNLHQALNLNNADFTIGGNLEVAQHSTFQGTLNVDNTTVLRQGLNVLNGSLTRFTGNLIIDGHTTLNQVVTINNQQPLHINGDLNVGGQSLLQQSLTVQGQSTIGQNLSVNQNAATQFNGALEIMDNTVLRGDLNLFGNTLFRNSVTISNQLPSLFTGNLTVNGTSQFESNLTVLNHVILNQLNVSQQQPSIFSGNLQVNEQSLFDRALQVSASTLINNDLTVTGNTVLENLSLATINISNDTSNYVAQIQNTNENHGDGLVIKLGRTHGAWNGNNYLQLTNPATLAFGPQLNTVKGWLDGGSFSPVDIINLTPTSWIASGMVNMTNVVIDQINSGLGLPISTPQLAIPSFTVVNGFTVFNGGRYCLPQSCSEVCDPFGVLGCVTVCIPPIQICTPNIPRIAVPTLQTPRIPFFPAMDPLIPAIPNIPLGRLPEISIPNFSFTVVNNSLTQENNFMSFQDKDGRITGSIKAQSTQDFRDNNLLDNTRVLNIASAFIGIDLLEGVVAGSVEISNLIYDFNRLGVIYSSGNGDYAEWLERAQISENLSPGDIVGVKGGKISKNFKDYEQLMVVSHRPIILGNKPQDKDLYKGNATAFLGQVPVKLMGKVRQGNIIIKHPSIKGYGIAINKEELTIHQAKNIVGRALESNLSEGPKLINTIVGHQHHYWADFAQKTMYNQQKLSDKITQLEQKFLKLNSTPNTSK